MTASPVALDDLVTTPLDFSDPNQSVYGLNARQIIGTRAFLWAGDSHHDGVINAVDYNIFWLLENGQPYQYLNTLSDFNLDGVINAVDMINFWRVNNSRTEQMP